MTDTLLTVDEYEEAACAVLSEMAYGYYRAGADEERTLRANREAFARWDIWYRVLVDVSERRLATTVVGTPASMPILIAPTAYHRLAHEQGELATARAAAAAGTVMVVSTLATTSLEAIAAATAAPKWFQLYVHKDRGFSRSLVERAAAAGYTALVVTVDTPVLGRRLADERSGFCLPAGMSMANLVGTGAQKFDEASMLAGYVGARHDASLGWKDLEWVRSLSSLPLVLKGIVRGEDAALAAGSGIAGIIVSNHGARQLDGAPATLDALPEVVDAVAGRCDVMMDGGVRWGTDILKALALGARAVLVGRPILWGLAVGGERGASGVLEVLRCELDRAMALAGTSDVRSVPRDLVRPRPR